MSGSSSAFLREQEIGAGFDQVMHARRTEADEFCVLALYFTYPPEV